MANYQLSPQERKTLQDNMWRNYICEVTTTLIWPIVYGLYYFEAVGEKLETSYDCWAIPDSNVAIPAQDCGILSVSCGTGGTRIPAGLNGSKAVNVSK